MKRTITFIAFLFLFVSGYSQCPLTTAVDFTVTTIDGKTFHLFDTLGSGKFVCIDFFYTTCVPCQGATPQINQAYEYFGCNSSNIIFISIDTGDDDAEVEAFDNTYGAHYPSVSGTQGGGNAVINTYQIGAFPTVILIAPNHSIVEQDIWPISTAQDVITPLVSHGGIAASCPTTAIDLPVIVPEHAMLSSVFPNPANDFVNITYSLPESGKIILTISDLSGKKVTEFIPYKSEAGDNHYELDSRSIPSGYYFLTLSVNNKVSDLRSLVIVR